MLTPAQITTYNANTSTNHHLQCLHQYKSPLTPAQITTYNAYTSTNKTKMICIKTELNFYPRADSHSCVHVSTLHSKLIPVSTLKQFADFMETACDLIGAILVDRCEEIRSAPSVT